MPTGTQISFIGKMLAQRIEIVTQLNIWKQYKTKQKVKCTSDKRKKCWDNHTYLEFVPTSNTQLANLKVELEKLL